MSNKRLIAFGARAIEFTVYSFLGWVYEMIGELVLFDRFSDRGYLHLPVCVIYGFFTIVIMMLFSKEKSRPSNVFFLSFVIVTAMEYVCAVVIEKILGRGLWDYSQWVFNFQGRVSLISSLAFATACTILVFVAHPFFYKLFTKRVNPKVTVIVGLALTAAMAVDFVITSIT